MEEQSMREDQNQLADDKEQTDARHVDHSREQFDRMMYELQAMDFTLFELNLFLDTHPFDRQSIEQYNQLAQKRRQFAEQFEKRYGPLVHGQSYTRMPWQWIQVPWPWQI